MKPLDTQWLKRQADDKPTELKIDEINEWREYTLSTNSFIDDDSRFIMKLNGLSLAFKVSSAFSAIETYQEIFRNDNHFDGDGFDPRNAQTIIDVGANQGFFALKAAKLNPKAKILSFEPNPYEYEILEENVRLNGFDNVKTYNLALSKKSGTLDMEIIPQIGPIGGACVRIPERKWIKDEFIQRITVDAVSLDKAIANDDLDRIDVLKIDVEGAEVDVLAGCSRFDLIDNVVLEYHSDELRNDLIDLLVGQGFYVVKEISNPQDYYGDLYFSKKRKTL